ncbi:MAG: hypothetical protein U5R14_14660 [Gemmatimonadota bacterium]|nr:hypothetical protein [Gemmatimonadota bacterium]
MRSRERVLQSLEKVYRSAFSEAEEANDTERMQQLDLEYQKDQIQLEVLLDIRELLALPPTEEAGEDQTSLFDRAQQLRNLTKLR